MTVAITSEAQPAGGATPRHPPARVRAFSRHPLIYAVITLYAGASVGLMAVHAVGVTAEGALLLALVLLSLVAPARAFVWDWLPFIGVAVMFGDLGTMVGKSAQHAHILAPIITERILLGGNVGSVWLQGHLRPAAPWLDVPLGIEYLTFFAAPIAFGLWLWMRRRGWFGVFVNAYISVMVVGFVVYVLYPETPPWLAAQEGLLPHVQRITIGLLNHLGGIGHLYGGADPAPNGAMPSLHVGIPTLISLIAARMRGWRRPASWLWLLYPLTMILATMYLGEHYLLDGMAGFTLGVIGYLGALTWARRAARRSVSPARTAPVS